MLFRIAQTFTQSLEKLTRDEQKAAKTTALDLQLNPAHPSLKFHKLDRAKDPNFWSVRVSRDIRLIVHKLSDSLMLCYVDHHDKAYRWAERRKLTIHPKTGAAQLVEIRETIQEIIIPTYIQGEVAPKPRLFEGIATEGLLTYGIPEDWIEEVRKVDEDTLLDLIDYLPEEAFEALMDLADGKTPQVLSVDTAQVGPFEHPDAQRRFRIIENEEELKQALEFPWDRWTIFLHPKQREVVEKEFNGPARVSGTAGTGKTIVALHRTVFLANTYPEARILLTTFSETLAQSLKNKLSLLLHPQPLLSERIEVHDLDSLAERLYKIHFGKTKLLTPKALIHYLQEAATRVPDQRFSQNFLLTEWMQVVDAHQLRTWEAYRDVLRLGRKTRIPESKRKQLWEIFSYMLNQMDKEGALSAASMYHKLTQKLSSLSRPPFDIAVVDEAQDIGIQQLKFLAELAGKKEDGLFFAGDLGQRIFQLPFSWKAQGVEIRGRSHTLRINYRTSHQIRKQADLLLDPQITDVDGNTEDRRNSISVFNGPIPQIIRNEAIEEELEAVSSWLQTKIGEGIKPEEIGIFVRSQNELDRAIDAVERASLPYLVLDEFLTLPSSEVSISTMHLAKGLEFRVVVIMACDDEVIPSLERIETISDEAELEEVYHTERHLLYVACTRARDQLLITSGDVASEFLDDMEG